MDSHSNLVRDRRRLGAVDRISRHPIRSTILVAIAAALATTALVLASSGSNSAVAASSLVNGNFETGDLTGWSVDTTNGGGANAVRASAYVYCGLDGICGPRGTIFPKEGSYFALLGSGIQQSEGPRISQSFEASNGDKVSGWVFVNTDSWFEPSYKGQVVIKSDSGTMVATPFEEFVTFGDPSWRYWEYTFSGLTGAGQFQIEARLQKTGNIDDHSTMGLDDVKLTTIPDNDTAAPSTSITSGPNGPTNTSLTFTFSGSDNVTTTANLKYQYQLDSGGWSAPSISTTANLTGLSEGGHLFEVRAVDEAGNVDVSPAQRSFKVDSTAPKVDSVIPLEDATSGVARTTDVKANFSEDMKASSITSTTFKLFKKGSTTKIAAQVSYPADPNSSPYTAKLDPTDFLRSGVTYKAVVTTGAKDVAGNPLAQQKVWFFKVG